jgi:diaminohydroxyphosphoribosylaminopyrimidine deaminase/5-amino-6-(5-phosphoribosylamino)uracil reductase
MFMKRALDLAVLGTGQVSPNPLVGCVIVHDDKIIGEGWHRKYGEAHAEVNAVNAVTDKSLLREATVYVNLEPCSHFGKTPPCADLLIRHHVKRVVIANLDTYPKVNGEGIRKLQESGAEVITGVLQRDARELNKRFFTSVEKNRPFVLLKWAETSDGFIARENYESKWISNELSRQVAHKLRTEVDAVLVGTRTARHDNPKLNVRDWSGKNPIRVVTDRYLTLSGKLHLFDKSQPTLCYNLLRREQHHNLTFVQLNEFNFWEELLNDLHRRKIQSVMVEGGAETIQTFINKGLWEEAKIFRAPGTFGNGITAPRIHGPTQNEERIMDDLLITIQNLT